MVGHLDFHRADDGDVVDALADFWEERADFDATLAVAFELEWGGKGCTSFAFGAQVATG